MKRAKFTKMLSFLLKTMTDDGNMPVVDYVLRSATEQKRLYDLGRSKCDGVKRKSKHQAGLAVDIYFVVNGKIDFAYNNTSHLADQYHRLWENLGGKKTISWDKPHYAIS